MIKKGGEIFQWALVLGAVAIMLMAVPLGAGQRASRLILALLLMFTGLIKFFDLKGFVLVVKSYGLLPVKLAEVSAYTHPFIELGLGLMLFYNVTPVLTAVLTLGNLAVSTGMLAGALIKDKKLENCGCFGTAIEVPVNWGKIVENLIWLLLSLYLLLAVL